MISNRTILLRTPCFQLRRIQCNNKRKFVLLKLGYSNIIAPILTIIIVANSQCILYMITQSIDYCEGNVLQLISLRQLIIVQLDIEYDMQLFHNFFR